MTWTQCLTPTRILLLLLLCFWPLYSVLFLNRLRLSSDVSQNPELEAWNLEMEQITNSKDNETSDKTESWREEETSRFLQILNHRLHVQHRKDLKDAIDKKILKMETTPFNVSHDVQARVMELFAQEVNCPSLRRIGGYGMDGRWICGFDTFLSNKAQCIVYSFGANLTQLEVEIEFLKETSCQVHLFDPFLPFESVDDLVKLSDGRFHYHNSTLASREDVNYLFDELRPDLSYIEERTIDQIMLEMGHPWVDVIKFDFQGDDWEKVKELILGGMRRERVYHRRMHFPIGQLLFRMMTGGDPARVVELMIPLMNRGFSVYHAEPNLRAESPWEDVFFSLIHVDARSKFVIHS